MKVNVIFRQISTTSTVAINNLEAQIRLIMKKICLFLLFPLFAFAQNNLEQKIADVAQKYDAVGITVSVVKNNKPLYDYAYGVKDLASDEKLSVDDIFRIASISKSFSSVAIFQLIEKGMLNLEDEVSDLIGFEVKNPHFPDNKITLKMLLSHTSSIGDSQGYFALNTIDPNKNENWGKCYNNYQPGSAYEYSNLGFNMVGTIIERVSGERFDEYIVNHILNPLKLYGGFNVSNLDQDRFVTLYEFENGKYVSSPNAYHSRKEEISNYTMGYSTPIFSPTGGMKISTKDLANYMQLHMNYGKKDQTRLINKKNAKLMQTPVNKDSGYGLALLKTDKIVPGVTLTGHTGSAYGLYSFMFFNPKKKYGMVIITNGCHNCQNNPDDENEQYNKLLDEMANLLYTELIK